ncbi:hypothetical protein HOK021_33280 [Streptomyces hygroscopicus]|nr:hypothetical protein HOK021_33280 [Streptomyces hygroscopicus]
MWPRQVLTRSCTGRAGVSAAPSAPALGWPFPGAVPGDLGDIGRAVSGDMAGTDGVPQGLQGLDAGGRRVRLAVLRAGPDTAVCSNST